MRCHLLLLLSAGAVLASSSSAQANDVPRNNGGDVVFFYSDPSLGAPLGSPPDLQGDLFWTVHPGVDQLAYSDGAPVAQMEIAGYQETIFDTDWSTMPWFYDRTHGPALPGASGGLEPAFFQLGLTSEVTVALGPTGFGSPCTLAPSICSPGGCGLGFTGLGWIYDIQLGASPGSGVVVTSSGTSASDLATTWFLPGGMPASGGLCGEGDYAQQDVHSSDETAADPGGGVNPWGGYQLGGSGPVQEPITDTVESIVTWRGPVLNPRADSGAGLEVGPNGGGGQNGFLLSVSGGAARLSVELRDELGAGVPGNLAFVGASLTPLTVPGATILGAQVLVKPDPLFAATVQVWKGSLQPIVFLFTPEGAFQTVALDVPPALAGGALFVQGLTLDPATLGARTTNRVRVRLF